MKRKMSAFITAAATISCATICMASITFSDINNVPWEGAKNYIVKVADLGLMVGQENGDGTSVFRAKDKVTYCETVQLIYNILKDQGRAEPSESVTAKWKMVMERSGIPEWAHEATAYCLENGIISVEDIAGFVETDGSGENATREDVALIFGRAIDENAEDEKDFGFNDSSKISEKAAPYVNLLAEKNILVGDSNKNFNPDNFINRAEMAVVATKTYGFISGEDIDVSDSSVSGTVSGLNKSGNIIEINVTGKDGSQIKLSGVKGTPIKTDAGKTDIADISEGDEVTLNYTGNFITSGSVEKGGAKSANDSIVTGTVNNITNKKIAVNLNDGSQQAYNISGAASVTLNGEKASAADISDVIDNGLTVDVTVKLSAGQASDIAASGETGVVEGTISDIDSSEVTIMRTRGNEKSFDIADGVKIKLDGKTAKIGDISDALENDSELFIRAELDDSKEVEKMTVSYSQSGGTASGMINKITDEKISLSTSTDDSTGYYFEGAPKVVYEGDEITLSSLERKVNGGTEISATVYLNDRKKVTKIEAVSEEGKYVTVKNLTDNNITIVTDSGFENEYLLADDVDVKYSDGSKVNFGNFKEVYIPGKTKVKLTINSKSVVTRIVADIDSESYDKISGKVKGLNGNGIKVGGKTVYFSEDTLYNVDGKETELDEILEGYEFGEEMDATVIFSEDIARNVTIEITSVSGKISDMKKGYITLSSSEGSRQYQVASDEELVVKYSDESKAYDFQNLYGRWYTNGEDFSVECMVDNGVIVKIEAKRI